MFVPNETHAKLLSRLWAALGDTKPGTVIPYAAIEAIIGARHGTKLFRTMANKLMLEFKRKRGIEVDAERMVGLNVHNPRSQLTVVVGTRIKRAGRQLGRGITAAVNVKPEQLGMQDAKLRAISIGTLQASRRELRKAAKARKLAEDLKVESVHVIRRRALEQASAAK